MNRNEKTLIGGIVLGAILATVAICAFMKKCTEVAEAHLFDLENQEEKKIDELIPYEASEATADAPQEGEA